MSQLSKFYALSAVYLGLASAVVAQPAQPGSGAAAAQAEEARPDRFEHPMLERHGSTDMRPAENDGPRIQRRGMQDMRQDGGIRRHTLPGAADADGVPPQADRREDEADRLHDRHRQRR